MCALRFFRRRLWFLLGLVLLLLAGVSAQEVGLARHKRIFVVPAPGPVTIDGKLDDWDLSGQIWMWVTLQTAEMQGAQFAMMYDDEALYVSAVVRDPRPMMNRHDPLVDPDKAWDADVCQLRLMLDPDSTLSVPECGRRRQRAVGHDEPVVLHRPARSPACRSAPAITLSAPAAPAMAERGGAARFYPGRLCVGARQLGYTFEYRLPWSTLGMKASRRPATSSPATCSSTGAAPTACIPPAAAPGPTM